MKKIVSIACLAVTAAVALSACNPTVGNNGASQNSNFPVTNGTGAQAQARSAPRFTVAQQNAIESAQSYLSMGSGFSRAGLIGQLSSKAGDGFKKTDAAFAVDHIKVNWNQQAVESAKAYLSMGTGFSRAGLIDQLHSAAGDGFTLVQAEYAAHRVGL